MPACERQLVRFAGEVLEVQYGVRALVKREKANPAIPLQKPTIEDIMLFLVKGEMKL